MHTAFFPCLPACQKGAPNLIVDGCEWMLGIEIRNSGRAVSTQLLSHLSSPLVQFLIYVCAHRDQKHGIALEPGTELMYSLRAVNDLNCQANSLGHTFIFWDKVSHWNFICTYSTYLAREPLVGILLSASLWQSHGHVLPWLPFMWELVIELRSLSLHNKSFSNWCVIPTPAMWFSIVFLAALPRLFGDHTFKVTIPVDMFLNKGKIYS